MYYSPAQTTHTDEIAVLRDYIDTIKARHGFSQRAQAEALGVGWTTMRDWLNGKAKWPKTAQIVLREWSEQPLSDDDDDIAAQCQISLSLADERALIAAWRCVRSDDQSYTLPSTVRDWPLDMLKEFVREGHHSPAFQLAVQAELSDFDPVTDECRTLPLPNNGRETLYRKAYEWCTPAVLERLVDLLD